MIKLKPIQRRIAAPIIAASLFMLTSLPVSAEGYDKALHGVNQVKAVFDVTQGSPKTSNLVFWAVQNVYQDETVQKLDMPPEVAVIFHGPAVKLLSSDRSDFKPNEHAEIDKFQDTLRQMKKDGVKLEVCDYALKVMKVDPATVIPEVDRVGNGFVSVVGYQAQGYEVVRIP